LSLSAVSPKQLRQLGDVGDAPVSFLVSRLADRRYVAPLEIDDIVDERGMRLKFG